MDPLSESNRLGFIGMFDCMHSRSFHGLDLPTSVPPCFASLSRTSPPPPPSGLFLPKCSQQ
jgi:hypothetical protein